MIVTFYSYKGGVGRSMALINIAELFTAWGYRVIVCDWDLEAPGLERYLVPMGTPLFRDKAERDRYQAYMEQALAHDGLMNLFEEYKLTLRRTPKEAETGADDSEFTTVGRLKIRRPSSRAYVPEGRTDDLLRILSAGRRDAANVQEYAKLVREFDWTEFYDKWAGDSYLELFRKDLAGDPRSGLPGAADIVLIDSRTGVTEQGGVCTHHLADIVVLFTAPNEANVAGTKEMVRTLTDPGLPDLRDGRPVYVLPVAARVDVIAERDLLNDFLLYFQEEVGRAVPPNFSSDYLVDGRIPYITYYAFRERVVTREAKNVRQRELYSSYTRLASLILQVGLENELLAEDRLPSDLRPQAASLQETTRRRLRGAVFLSYALDDRDLARELREALQQQGLDVAFGGPTDTDTILSSAAAALFVIGERGLTPSMRAELDLLVKRTAAGTPVAIVAVLTGKRLGSPLLAGYKTFVLPEDVDDEDFIESLINEIASPPVPVIDLDLKPYMGPQPYGEGESRLFFGRDVDVELATLSLAKGLGGPSRWLRIEGASGIGVTSFARAGLVPALRRGAVSEIPRDAIISYVTIGTDPLFSLAAALNIDPAITVEEVRNALERPSTLFDYARRLLRERRVVFVIDGFHALTDLAPQVTASFAAALEVLLDPSMGNCVITTARSVAMATLTLPGKLGELMKAAEVFSLAAMTAEEIHSAITAPANLQNLTFEPGLVDRIASELFAPLYAPAVLSVILEKLWQKRSGTLMTHAAYVENGGVAGVVRDLTENCLAKLTGEDKEQARRIVIRLVSGVGTRLKRAPDAILISTELRRVLSILVASRIVLVHADAIELTHDAVLTAPTVQKWLEEDREARNRRAELELAARSWKSSGKPSGGLPTGAQREYFETVESSSPDVIEYLAAARRYERRSRLIGGTAAILILAFSIGWPVMQANRARQASDVLARVAIARADTDPIDGLRLALLASRDRKSALQVEAVTKAAKRSVEPQEFRPAGRVEDVELSDDGNIAAIQTMDGIDVWNLRSRRQIAALTSKGKVSSLGMSADGRYVAAGHYDARAEVWRVSPLERVWRGSAQSQDKYVTMDDRGALVAMWTRLIRDGLLIANRSVPSSGQIPRQISNAGIVRSVEFLPRDFRVVVVAEEGSMWVGEALLGTPFEFAGSITTKFYPEVAFSANGRYVARATYNGVVIWDSVEVTSVALDARINQPLAIDSRGERLAGLTEELSIILYDRPTKDFRFLKPEWRYVTTLAFSPDGEHLVGGGQSGGISIWSTSTGKLETTLVREGQPVQSVRFSPDGKRVLATYESVVRVWDPEFVEKLKKLESQRDPDYFKFAEERLKDSGIEVPK